MSGDDTHAPVFQALITPYRSLTRNGVTTLLVVLSLFAGLIVLRFWLLGAWPVVLFSVLEIPLVAFLLWLNFRRGRAREMILIDQQSVQVTRTDWRGRRSRFALPVAWLRVDHDTQRGASRILLRSRGKTREVGGFLHEPERESLYKALVEALFALRNPRFDNPQLRDDHEG